MSAVPRHYYDPTPMQRAELRLRAMQMRMHLRRVRAEREAREQFIRIGFDEKAADELAKIHAADT